MTADVIIIGSGQAGAPLAFRLSRAAKSVILFEGSHLGGTCVNVGCTPTKTFIASAQTIVDAEMVHPTFAEGLQTLVMRLDRYALS